MLNSHVHAEVHHGLQGKGEVTINGQQYRIAPGVALFSPGGAMHGFPLATSRLKWFYTLATDDFGDIHYHFPRGEKID